MRGRLLALAALCGAVSAPALAAAPAAPALSLLGATFNVADPEGELGFYRDLLGMTLAMKRETGGGTEYILRFGADPAAAGLILMHAPGRPAITHGTGFSRLVLRVGDIDALAARLDAAGHAHSPVKDVAHGYRMMMLSDPEGYRLELVQAAQQR